MPISDYTRGIEKWRAEMDANVRRENDWLATAGLFWLKNGFNTFGSSRDCDIRLPERAPRLLGAFELDRNAKVTLHVDIGQSVAVNGDLLQNAAALRTDEEQNPSIVAFEGLRIVVIRRANKVGLRLWDNQRGQRNDFPPRKWFPVDDKFRIHALYTPYPIPVKIMMPNAYGEIEEGYAQGYVSFKIDGKGRRLDATELEDGCLYMQFKDLTNGLGTYPAGRYHYTEPVEEDGQVFLDFNRAYNPPSAFTDFATCTYAPKQNHLNSAVRAGEMY